MRWSILYVGALILLVSFCVDLEQVWSYPSHANETGLACATCHVSETGGPELTDAGKAYQADGTVPAANDLVSPEYIGAAKCKMCHGKEYKAWQKTKHATALATLQNADADQVAAFSKKLGIEIKGAAAESDQCLTCHVTGYQLAGGYPGETEKATEAVANVTCESCHGPGGLHKKAKKADKKSTINNNVTAGTCMGCHTKETNPDFNFEEMKTAGVHQVN